LWLEQRTWQLQIFFESGNLEKTCEELVEMIRYNYTQVKDDFQSIYNLHELLVTLAVRMTPGEPSFDFMTKAFDGSKPDAPFPDFAATQDFLVALYGSFRYYATYDLSDKSVNA
jgi:hypothetical protein